jgi:ketosteroid isomerase-like protein
MPATPQAVLDHHLSAFDSGDLAAILSDYAPDALLLTPDGTFRGHAQIRPVLQRLLDDIFASCRSFEMLRQIVEGDVAYIVWSAQSARYQVPLATDTYLIQSGKIQIQTFTARLHPAPR